MDVQARPLMLSICLVVILAVNYAIDFNAVQDEVHGVMYDKPINRRVLKMSALVMLHMMDELSKIINYC